MGVGVEVNDIFFDGSCIVAIYLLGKHVSVRDFRLGIMTPSQAGPPM